MKKQLTKIATAALLGLTLVLTSASVHAQGINSMFPSAGGSDAPAQNTQIQNPNPGSGQRGSAPQDVQGIFAPQGGQREVTPQGGGQGGFAPQGGQAGFAPQGGQRGFAPGGGSQAQNPLVGTWYMSAAGNGQEIKIRLTLDANGNSSLGMQQTSVEGQQQTQMAGTWRLDGNRLSFTDADGTVEHCPVQFDGQQLVMDLESEGVRIGFVKQKELAGQYSFVQPLPQPQQQPQYPQGQPQYPQGGGGNYDW